MFRKLIALALFVTFLLAATHTAAAQAKGLAPSVVVKQFYELLRAKRYPEGLALSVYRSALEGLTTEELQELTPEFERLAMSLPEHVVIQGEQISGEIATVFVQMPDKADAQNVALIKVDGNWIIGDRDTQKFIKKQGRNYFFSEKIRISESEAKEWMMEILGYELVNFQAKQQYLPLEEIIKLGYLAPLSSGVANGYKFTLQISADRKSFVLTATPTLYGRSGKLSFYSDQTNQLRADDTGGKPATATAPTVAL